MDRGIGMMNIDNYLDLAEKYDYMLSDDPERNAFFKKVFSCNQVKTLLDCSCGTGSDLIMFNSIVENVTGSDLSGSMLSVARRKIQKKEMKIDLHKADFRYLSEAGFDKLDAIVCLSSSICEIHSDDDVLAALKSMTGILNKNGVLIIDQGQSDAMMKSKPRFIPVINNSKISRLFVIDYSDESDKFITVNICDLEHTQKKCSFSMNPFKLRVRLVDEWKELLQKADITDYRIYGDWGMSEYDKSCSKRLVIVGKK
jgi:glycine/sarcosine N-methyltransferase